MFGERDAKPPEEEYKTILPKWCVPFGVRKPAHYAEKHPAVLFYLENEEPLFEVTSNDFVTDHIPFEKTIVDHKQKQAVVTFDLSSPLKPQLLSVNKTLSYLSSAVQHTDIMAMNRKRSEYPNYIRIIDADSAGASPMEIAAVFFPGEINNSDNEYRLSKKIKNDRSAARKLRDGGYASLPCFSIDT